MTAGDERGSFFAQRGECRCTLNPPSPLPPSASFPPSPTFGRAHAAPPRAQVYFVYEMSLIVWKERVFDALKERLRNNTIRVINAARERNLSDLDDNDVVKSLLKTWVVPVA